VFFRAQDFPSASRLLQSMLLLDGSGTPLLDTWAIVSATATVALVVSTHVWMRDRQLHDVVSRTPVAVLGIAWGAMLLLMTLAHGGSDAFIYFQF
jgi:alginate O-acetyltransferase complex protein AlgI